MATTTLTGTTGNDILNAPGSVSTLVQGLQGNDTITLALANDEAGAGEGNDNVSITRQGIVVNTIQGGDGNDTVFIRSANQFAGYVDLGAGNDSITLGTAAFPLTNGGQIYGGEGSDTLKLEGSFVNSTVGAGSGNDLLSFSAAGSITSSLINGGKEKDTINLSLAGGGSFATVAGGQGSDIISLTNANFANSIVGGGQGTDSINAFVAVATVAGGGLNDTIRIATFNGGQVFGDASGVTTAGTGTEGSADGADLIVATAQLTTAAVSIYGAGGNDTIALTAGMFTGAAGTSNVVDGGDGADSINIFGADTTGNITGGAGLDTINWSGAATQQAVTSLATITGGDGADVIVISDNAATFTAGANAGAGTVISAGTFDALISGASGDKLVALTGTTFGTAQANWSVAGNPTVFVASSLAFDGFSAAFGGFTGVGSVGVFSDGTDSVIGIYGGGAGTLFERIFIKGVDLTVTTIASGAATLTGTTFRFTIAAQTGGGMAITFA